MNQIREKSENCEHVYELVVDRETVCIARTLPYGILLEIHSKVKRKGYARKLLQHIEEVARQHGVTTMKTTNIDSMDVAATSFFKSMGYILEPMKGDEKFLEGRKNVGQVNRGRVERTRTTGNRI